MTTKIAVICGSLRKGSFSKAICDTLPELVDDAEFIDLDYASVPFYNDDLKENGSPAEVTALTKKLVEADALVLVSPEYNRAMSGVVKNFIDWMSKEEEGPLKGKAGLVITQSPGATGGIAANYTIRQTLSVCGVTCVSGYEVAVSGVMDKISDGKLTDQGTRDYIGSHLTQVIKLAKALKA